VIDDLLALAARLAKASPNRPRQADLKRAVSTAYYALFHALAKNGADCMVGTVRAARANKAWAQTYRALDHGKAKTACEKARNLAFPQALKDVADAFVELQKSRHDADYDPEHRLTRAQALGAVATAADAVTKLRNSRIQDRRALAALLLFQKR
jgi:uncharacterized protein (UPF0332 family)